MHDHAAVGATDETAPALASGGEHHLTQRGTACETTEAEGQHRRPAASADDCGKHHRTDTEPGGPDQPIGQDVAACLAPRQDRGDRHQEQQGEADRHGHLIEVRIADRDRATVDRLDDQREDGAEQHHEREAGEHHIVGQERALPRDRRVDPTGGPELISPPGDEAERHDDDQREEREEPRADLRLDKGVDRLQHTRAGDEGAENGERERRDDQGQVPDPQHASTLLDHHRMDERRAGQPRQEGRVLDRVPGPVAAPAEGLVAPPRTEHDAEGEVPPRQHGPPAGGDQPALTDPAGDERRDRERERHRESDITQIEDRRMERHQDVVLEQRIRAGAVVARRRIERGKRRRRADHQQEEERAHHEEREHHPLHHRVVAVVAELHDDRNDITAQHEHPQQH